MTLAMLCMHSGACVWLLSTMLWAMFCLPAAGLGHPVQDVLLPGDR